MNNDKKIAMKNVILDIFYTSKSESGIVLMVSVQLQCLRQVICLQTVCMRNLQSLTRPTVVLSHLTSHVSVLLCTTYSSSVTIANKSSTFKIVMNSNLS